MEQIALTYESEKAQVQSVLLLTDGLANHWITSKDGIISEMKKMQDQGLGAVTKSPTSRGYVLPPIPMNRSVLPLPQMQQNVLLPNAMVANAEPQIQQSAGPPVRQQVIAGPPQPPPVLPVQQQFSAGPPPPPPPVHPVQQQFSAGPPPPPPPLHAYQQVQQGPVSSCCSHSSS